MTGPSLAWPGGCHEPLPSAYRWAPSIRSCRMHFSSANRRGVSQSRSRGIFSYSGDVRGRSALRPSGEHVPKDGTELFVEDDQDDVANHDELSGHCDYLQTHGVGEGEES